MVPYMLFTHTTSRRASILIGRLKAKRGTNTTESLLLPGMKSGTLGGESASSLLGNITDYDGGASEFMLGPLTFFLIYNDHMVGYRFLPSSVDTCVCDVFWFVDEDAEEGRDYDLDKLTWLWDVTTQADEKIIVNNQKGVASQFYTPGNYLRWKDSSNIS